MNNNAWCCLDDQSIAKTLFLSIFETFIEDADPLVGGTIVGLIGLGGRVCVGGEDWKDEVIIVGYHYSIQSVESDIGAVNMAAVMGRVSSSIILMFYIGMLTKSSHAGR